MALMYAWKSYFIVQADYQHWANEVLFAALDHLNKEAIGADAGLPLASIHHGVDHLFAVAQLWQARLRSEAAAADDRTIHFPDWRDLKIALRREMRKLQSWLEAQPEDFFASQIVYVGGDGGGKPLWARDALTHLFTRMAHGRGQIAAAATRLGAPEPDMDFLRYRQEMERLINETRAGGQPPAAG